ncbi:MAG: hypothetical protein HFG67_00250 [Firmicutes bacterium]|nr:hypothetical protein [Bacillota bacterium]
MKEKLAKLIDVKSIVTLAVTANLIFVIDYVMLTGATVDDKVFLLFSNVVTMIVTYFFTKKNTETKTVE